MTPTRPLLLAAAVLALAACQPNASQPATSTPASKSATTATPNGNATLGDGLGDSIDRAMGEARDKLNTGNITISHDGARRAEITPKGDLLIEGKAVAINDEQRRLLLDYRDQVMQIASAGMGVGAEGAKLATKAVGEAIGGLLSGQPDRIEQRVQAQAQGIKQAALKLCDRLPAMYASQQRVAAAVPEFAPYATMKMDDIKDCRHDAEDGTTPQAATP